MSDEKPITVVDLAEARACPRETGIFKEMWGEGGVMTKEKVAESALRFDWVFAAKYLLSERQQRFFRSLIAQDFKRIPVGTDPRQERRRRAMAMAFYRAWNSTEN